MVVWGQWETFDVTQMWIRFQSEAGSSLVFKHRWWAAAANSNETELEQEDVRDGKTRRSKHKLAVEGGRLRKVEIFQRLKGQMPPTIKAQRFEKDWNVSKHLSLKCCLTWEEEKNIQASLTDPDDKQVTEREERKGWMLRWLQGGGAVEITS